MAQHASPEQTREERIALANRRLGLAIFQASWMLTFVCLVVVNWLLRGSYPSWPPPDVAAMGVALPTLATALLGVSLWLSWRGLRAVQADALGTVVRTWGAALALGVVFVAIMLVEFLRVETVTQYGAVFRLMTGFHVLHAVAVGVFMLNVWTNARYTHAVRSGAKPDDGQVVPYGAAHFWGVEAGQRMWAFVFFAWLLFYVVLYWWRT